MGDSSPQRKQHYNRIQGIGPEGYARRVREIQTVREIQLHFKGLTRILYVTHFSADDEIPGRRIRLRGRAGNSVPRASTSSLLMPVRVVK